MNLDTIQKKGCSATAIPHLVPTPIYGYDRVTLWIDQPELPVSTDYFGAHCTKFVVKLEQMNYNANWKLKLDIFQPTIICLEQLLESFGAEINTIIVYVEFACDTPASNKAQSQQWQLEFIAAAKLEYQQQSVVNYKGTDYYGRIKGESKRGHIMVVYSDRPSKLNNAQPKDSDPPCLHIEHRVKGSDFLLTRGIVSLSDLIKLDFPRFFENNTQIYKLPKLTELGRLLAHIGKSNTDVSTTALRKRANKWKSKHSIKESFVMHNALKNTQELIKHLDKEPFSAWLKKVTNNGNIG